MRPAKRFGVLHKQPKVDLLVAKLDQSHSLSTLVAIFVLQRRSFICNHRITIFLVVQFLPFIIT